MNYHELKADLKQIEWDYRALKAIAGFDQHADDVTTNLIKYHINKIEEKLNAINI